MKYCPLISFQKQYTSKIPCLEEECAFAADGTGNCLIRQALQCYVSKENTRIIDETTTTYSRIFKDGSREPITFMNEPHYEDG